MNEIDAVLLSNWGFNVVRLGVMWSGLEPEENYYNTTYITEIKKIVKALGNEGVYTIIDMHQDVFSRDFCGNGFPNWSSIVALN